MVGVEGSGGGNFIADGGTHSVADDLYVGHDSPNNRLVVTNPNGTYTGLVPLIYKAQHSMLDGLMLGFAGDLILIGVAMIFLMRDWSAGLLLALPSVFPIAIVFGAIGYLGIVVDTGTVMTPAVALGVTVDDAIHFMLWCRHGQERGMDRPRAIMFAIRTVRGRSRYLG